MNLGVHLPQYGSVAGPDAIREVAVQAELMGFSDVWVSDHIIHPANQSYPSPYLYDPLLTLAWAGAATSRVGLGTSVLVVPTHNPLTVANALASLDALTNGRLIVGVGVGWSEAEYQALGAEFSTRGARLDEALAMWRIAWRDDPVSFEGRFSSFDNIRLLPKPSGPVPVWIGGTSAAARRRAIAYGDGVQLLGVTPESAKDQVTELRLARPDESFTISLRAEFDPQHVDGAQIRDELAAFEEAGVQHVVTAPAQRTVDSWIHSMDLLAQLAL